MVLLYILTIFLYPGLLIFCGSSDSLILGISSFFSVAALSLYTPPSDGESREVSFRDVAHLCVIGETDIQAERTPVLSGQRTGWTAEKGAFRVLVDGEDDLHPPTLLGAFSASASAAEQISQGDHAAPPWASAGAVTSAIAARVQTQPEAQSQP